MGAERTWTVVVLKLVEGTVEVSAVTETEALKKAGEMLDVAKAVYVAEDY
jgi:hypothetical protein